VSRAACETAHILGAAAIVSVTKSGHTANMVSRYRPACPILATTASRKVFNQLSLSWGVYPDMTERKNSTDEVFKQAVAKAAESSMIKSGDLVVITGGMIADVSGTTNMIKVHIVGDVLLEGKGGAPYRTSGSVCVIQTPADLIHFNVGEVIVIRNTSDEVLSVLRNAAAVVTEEPERESQAVIAARALGIPAVSDAENATEILKSGTVVTVDGKKGVIYSGIKK